MFTKRVVVSLAAFLFSVALATPASASYVVPGDLLEFSFFNLGTVGAANDLDGSGDDTYDIKVVLDFSDYTGPDTDYIYAVSIGVGLYDDAELQSTTAPGTWVFEDGGLSNNGCQGSSNSQMCAQDGQSAVLGGTGTYQWIFRVDTTAAGIGHDDDPNDPDDGTSGDIHLKALWQHNNPNSDDIKDDTKAGGNISLTFPFDTPEDDEDVDDEDLVVTLLVADPVPEPGSLFLLGSGLVAAAARFRRRRS